MKSADVIHAFWVPQFAGKRDLFPNRETRLWFTAEVTGAFPGACAEFCGTEHGRMDFYLMVDSVDQFKAWVARRQVDSAMKYDGTPMRPLPAPAPSVPAEVKTVTLAAADTATVDPLVAQGKALFTSKGCSGCHSLSSMHPFGIGPNLSGIGTRKMIGAGWLPNTDANLRDWMEHYDKVKPDVKMIVAKQVTDDEAAALIAYLRTMH
jgi:cytochrome c oxidase subunit 2